MITKPNLRELINRNPKPGSPTLSVYLDIDQSDAANLNRKFEVALFNVLRDVEQTLDSSRQRDFQADAIRIQDFVEGYRPRAKGLVIFSDTSENLFWAHKIQVPVKTEARWSEMPYLRPLIENPMPRVLPARVAAAVADRLRLTRKDYSRWRAEEHSRDKNVLNRSHWPFSLNLWPQCLQLQNSTRLLPGKLSSYSEGNSSSCCFSLRRRLPL